MVMMIKMIKMNMFICSHALQPDPCNILSSSDEDVEDDHDDHDQDDHVDRDGYDDQDDQDDHDECAHLQPYLQPDPCNILSSSHDDVEDDHDDHDYHDDDDYNDDHAHLQPCPAAPCNILSSPITAIIT